MAFRFLLEYPTKILLEDGTGAILLEDGSFLLDEYSAVLVTDLYLLEDGSGFYLLEEATPPIPPIPPVVIRGIHERGASGYNVLNRRVVG
jgi:hypothetical protein